MSTTETAVQRCVKAYYHACDIEDPHDTGLDPAARYRVHLAYRHAMPYLLPDPDAIDAFLACVTHGLVIQVFEPAEASKLLYAAQVALGSLRARNQAKSKSQPQQATTPLEGGEAAVGRTEGAMGTVSSSPRVGDHELKPTEPEAAAKPQSAAPQVPPKAQLAAPQVPQVPRNQVDELLEQLYAGKLPGEPQAPPPPSPLTRRAPESEVSRTAAARAS